MEGQDPLAAALGGAGEEQEEPVNDVNSDDITNIVASIEDLLSSIKSEMGGGEGMGDEEGFPEEGMEGDGDGDEVHPINTGEGDDEVHVDIGSHNAEDDIEGDADSDDMPPEEDEEEEAPPKKDKKFPPKK